MRNHITSVYSILLFSALALLISCDPAASKTGTKTDVKPSDQIDQVSEEAGELIDVFSEKAKEFLEGEEMEDLKDMVDDFSEKANEMVKDSAIWKAKLEEIKNDKELKELLENYKSDGTEMLSKLEKLLEDLGEKTESKE